ncbi:MAG TPA: efflux RND transporter periplasmic adaptor subunit [Cyclobacteriaceae bacterium]|jgi:membrane fusion protein (multidrug efflux system)|nr:efflux RND transporter periplasmic adaptor subunit [Cyclobacteriaceae bacterium]
MKKLSSLYLLFLIGSSYWFTACSSSSETVTQSPATIPVMKLETKDVFVPQTYIADIEAVQFVEIRSKVQGHLEKALVDEGQSVKKGQVLFTIDAQSYKVAVSNAEANLKKAISELKSIDLEIDRLSYMVDKAVISKAELEAAKSRKDAAIAVVDEQKMILSDAQINLSHTQVRAPFDGVIDRIPLKLGSLIDNGMLLTSISDTKDFFAYFKVTENEYLEFMRNQKQNPNEAKQTEVTLLLSDGSVYPHKGRVETMEGEFDKETGSIAFRARFANPDKLMKHGASGNIQMMKKYSNVALVPQKSSFEIQDRNYVYVVDKHDTVRATSFEPLERYEQYYLTKELGNGQRIVFEGVQSMRDKTKIQPSEPDMKKLTALSTSSVHRK